MKDTAPLPLSSEATRRSFLREHWMLVLVACLLAASCIDPLEKWYARDFAPTEIVVINDSDATISRMTVSLPSETADFSNVPVGGIVQKYVNRVVPTSGWTPNQIGTLSNGIGIIGNGIDGGEDVVEHQLIYIVRKDGTVSTGQWPGR